MEDVCGTFKFVLLTALFSSLVRFDTIQAEPQWLSGKSDPAAVVPDYDASQSAENVGIISHPWQIRDAPADLHASYDWKPAVDEHFHRSKRRHSANIHHDKNPALFPINATWTSDQTKNLTAALNKMAAMVQNNSTNQSGRFKTARLGTKWPSVSIHPYLSRKGSRPGTNAYNPLPYGLPYTKSRGSSESGLNSVEEYHGLPFARRTVQRNKGPAPLRLPIPDSEIHYRKPVNDSILRAYHEIVNEKYGNPSRVDDNYPASRSPNTESFKILIEVIRALMRSAEEKSDSIQSP